MRTATSEEGNLGQFSLSQVSGLSCPSLAARSVPPAAASHPSAAVPLSHSLEGSNAGTWTRPPLPWRPQPGVNRGPGPRQCQGLRTSGGHRIPEWMVRVLLPANPAAGASPAGEILQSWGHAGASGAQRQRFDLKQVGYPLRCSGAFRFQKEGRTLAPQGLERPKPAVQPPGSPSQRHSSGPSSATKCPSGEDHRDQICLSKSWDDSGRIIPALDAEATGQRS